MLIERELRFGRVGAELTHLHHPDPRQVLMGGPELKLMTVDPGCAGFRK